MSPLWITIIGAIITAVLTGIITFIITKYSITKKYSSKNLICTILGRYSLLNFSQEIKDDIKIFYKEEQTQSISMFQFQISNIGNEAIDNQPVIIQFDENTIIKDFNINTEPPIGFGNITTEISPNSTLNISIELLNPKDSLILEIITINNSSNNFNIYSKNKNVKFAIYDYQDEAEEVKKFALELSKRLDKPMTLLPLLPEIIRSYPKLFRLMKADKK